MAWLETIKLTLQSFLAIRDDIKVIANFFRQAQEERWFANLDQAIRPLEGPTTKEQKSEAAKSISDSIKSL